MTTNHLVRVAAIQFAVGTDVGENLATCLRMIDLAAEQKPDLIVTPEFINHCAWYPDTDYSYRVAVALDGDFLKAIGAKAAEHHCYIKVNCTVQRVEGKVTGTNILFDPNGDQIAVNDKQILMGNENNFLERATEVGPIVQTPVGKLGMYCCMDGVIPEPARGLAVRGAQVLLNSLNSFAYDEASLHIPVRASENKVFVVAANKVGPLVPPHMADAVAERMNISPYFLHGAGESQIVAPDGTVLAKGPRTGEAAVVAEIDLARADSKIRPDGTDILASRRPDLYRPLGQPPRPRAIRPGAEQVTVAVYQPTANGLEAVEEVAEAVVGAARSGVKLIVFPELFHLVNGEVVDPKQAAHDSIHMIQVLQAVLQSTEGDCYVAVSGVVAANGFRHEGMLIGRDGIVLRQPQLHQAGRHAGWLTDLGDGIHTIDLPWGRVAMVVGGDSIYPEAFRLAVLQDAEVVVVPTQILEKWELETGLLERASENRVNVVVGSRAESAIIALDRDFTLWTPWQRPFDGNINTPNVTRTTGKGLTQASIYPACSENRMISQKTNLVDGRPWQLVGALIA